MVSRFTVNLYNLFLFLSLSFSSSRPVAGRNFIRGILFGQKSSGNHGIQAIENSKSKFMTCSYFTLHLIQSWPDRYLSAFTFSILVPAPQHLTLERQLNKSVLIGWSMPDPPGCQLIESYHVYVDGVLKVTVKANERTRALVEGVDLNRVRTNSKIGFAF